MTAPKAGNCACCGRVHASGDGATSDKAAHFVEQDVLDCFNGAYAEAVWRGADTVALTHLVRAISRHGAARDLLMSCGIEADVLAAVVEAALPSLVMTQHETSKPTTSADLAHLLVVTRQTAALHGSRYLTLRHVLGSLLNPPRSLSGGEIVSRWLWAARRYPGVDGLTGAAVAASTQRERSSGTSASEQERRQLYARLDRQERLLETLIERAQHADYLRMREQTSLSRAAASASEMQRPSDAQVPPVSAKSSPGAVVIPLDDVADDETEEIGQEPDPELEKLGVKRYYLSLDDDVVRAPSIGPRTAARLHPHGITHVKHLLSCEPERLSVRLGARHITASRIVLWKNQARLVCTIPWLRGTHAQLLVGAGYSSIDRILSTDRSTVCAAVMQFATTKDGQAILRAGPPPELDRIMRWIENSQQAEPQRAQIGRTQLN